MAYLYYHRAPGLAYFGEPAPAPARKPTLTGPSRIERGATGTFTVTDAPAGATFSNWRFTGGGVTVTRPDNNNLDNWKGWMVQSGTVSVDLKMGNATQTLSMAVSVTPRRWTENTPAIPLGRTNHGTLPIQPRLGRPGVDARDPGLGTSTATADHNVKTAVIPSGPNSGFNVLVEAPVTWHPKAFSNNALYDPSHPFYRAHDPSRRGSPLPGNRLPIATIKMNVEAHEGIVAPPAQAGPAYASHWQQVINHLAQPGNQINIPLERDVSHQSKETNVNYGARVGRFINTRVEAAKLASRPHPPDIFKGSVYSNYPYIQQRSLHLLANRQAGRLALTNPAGGRVTWTSSNPAAATVDAKGIVRPVGQGTTTIRVTNVDGDVDEINVVVDP